MVLKDPLQKKEIDMRLILTSLLVVLLLPIAVLADPFTPKQTQAIEGIVRGYLLGHPELLIEVSQALRDKQAQVGISQGASQLFGAAQSPGAGNPKSPLKLVEFFDYQCPHCKHSEHYLEEVLQKNPDVHVIYKQLPIFGAESDFAARAALAARKQKKYQPLHLALMKSQGRLNQDKVLALAKQAGLDTDKLKTDMKDQAITDELKQNAALAQRLALRGTPAFVVGYYPSQGDQYYGFIPGAPKGAQDLQALLDNAKTKRQSSK